MPDVEPPVSEEEEFEPDAPELEQSRSTVVPRGRLEYLMDKDGGRIEGPTAVASALKEAWEPVWRGSPASDYDICRYLRGYNKRIPREVPNIGIDDVIAVVMRPKSSCPGPNGIPFIAYAVLCDLAAPILLRVISFMMKGGSPKRGFNWCTAFFLPKDDTRRPLANRPIAASDTRNRIIADVIRRALEPVFLPLLDVNQTGFVRGRTIDESTLFLNDKFYSSLYTRYSSLYPGPGKEYKEKDGSFFTQGHNPYPLPPENYADYYVLFLDFKKAFDSVSRKFLLALLAHMGLSEGYLNIIDALYVDVQANPSVGGKS